MTTNMQNMITVVKFGNITFKRSLQATEAHKSESEELMALKEYVANLHKECDFLMQNFDARKTARTNEIEAIKKAKAVLQSGKLMTGAG